MKIRLARGLLLATLVGSSAACSSLKVAYSFADNLIEERIEQYLDLSPEQERVAESDVDAFVSWHRRTMLSRYAAYLESLAAAHAAGTMDRQAFDIHYAGIERLYRDTLSGGLPPLTRLLSTQSPEQVEHLASTLAERRKELAENLKSPLAEQSQKQAEGFIGGFESALGELTDLQRKLINTRVRAIFAQPELWLQNRMARDDALVNALRKRMPVGELMKFLRTWLLKPDSLSSPEYRAYSKKWQSGMRNMVYDVLQSASPEQRVTLVKQLREYAEEISGLAS